MIPYNRIAVVLFTVVVVTLRRLRPARHLARASRARRDPEPSDGRVHGHPDRARRYLDVRARVAASGASAASRSRSSATSGPELGQSYIVDSFLVVVLGGVGKLVGSVFAAFSLGILNKLLEPIAGAVLGKIVVSLAVILVIQKRPQGLFAPKGRSVESA